MDPNTKLSPALRRRVLAALTTLVALVFFAGQVALPAQAGDGCKISLGFVCGRIQNAGSSNSGVNVHDGWGPNQYDAGDTAHYTLKPGHWSVYKDTDGYCIPPNVRAYSFVYISSDMTLYRSDEYIPDKGWRCLKVDDAMLAIIYATKSKAKTSGMSGVRPMGTSTAWQSMQKKAKAAAKAKFVKVCKTAKKAVKNQKNKKYKTYKKYFNQCAKYGVKVPKK